MLNEKYYTVLKIEQQAPIDFFYQKKQQLKGYLLTKRFQQKLDLCPIFTLNGMDLIYS